MVEDKTDGRAFVAFVGVGKKVAVGGVSCATAVGAEDSSAVR